MAAAVPFPPPPTTSTSENDIFSISDAQLAQRYQFIREIGAGNWGCVWLCSPKSQDNEHAEEAQQRVAVKLVFREKKPTTAQRVRSLWNEMKIVRALKSDPHPSIVPFHSFIITPSFAIVTMEYLPHLIPVEVPETKAREWFRCLLSAVLFLHSRGVVHNDIKPANILLSKRKVPVLVDFGFAERYDTTSKRAFLSNLAYGTPEYLSPERARGNVHDTRKSDMWSLGITFFEILVGRTPFEYVEGEKFATSEDLERYWARTVKGKWVGEWKMSKGAERLLKKMISSNADVRITAKEAMKDLYWSDSQIPTTSRKTDENSTPEKEVRTKASFVRDSPETRPEKAGKQPLVLSQKENEAPTPPSKEKKHGKAPPRGPLVRRAPSNLPTIQGSPFKPSTSDAKENSDAPAVAVRKKRGPVPRKHVRSLYDDVAPAAKRRESYNKDKEAKDKHRKNRVLLDMTDKMNNIFPTDIQSHSKTSISKGSQDRVKAFERLKELERSRFLEEEDEDVPSESQGHVKQGYNEQSKLVQGDVSQGNDEEGQIIEVPRPSTSQLLPTPTTGAMSSTVHDTTATTPNSFYNKHLVDSIFSEIRKSAEKRSTNDAKIHKFASDTFPRIRNGSSLSLLKQGVKVSIDKTIRLYKSSTLGRTSKHSEQQPSRRSSDEDAVTRHESWEDDSLLRQAKSSLPVVRQALRAEQVAADNKADRMTIWIRNVEQVVKEAQENFAFSSVMPLPPLPARPVHRPNGPRNARPNRVPRKILPADQIFRMEVTDPTSTSFSPSEYITPDSSRNISTDCTSPGHLSKIPTIDSPRQRRATISSTSPESESKIPTKLTGNSPSKWTDKAKSSGNLNNLVRPISPLDELRKQLEKEENHETPNLSAMLDRSVFVARTTPIPALHEVPSIPTIPNITLSPEHSQSCLPLRPPQGPDSPSHLNALREANSSPTLSSPARRHIEGVYDRFLMATTGVKRVGRGYQSYNTAPLQNVPGNASKSAGRRLGMGRRPMPPPVSSDDLNRMGFVDDFGNFAAHADPHFQKDDTNSAVRSVTKAFKAIVTGKSLARRQSKVIT